MKLQRSTVMLVGVALLLGAGVLIAESQRPTAPETATVNRQTSPILTFEETDVVTLTVERQEETLAFQAGENGEWQMTQPEVGPAEPGAVAFLLSRLNTDVPLETVTMAPDQVADFGFTAPAGTVTITLRDGTEHTLILGGQDFSGSARYAIVDPGDWPPVAGDATNYEVLVVTQDVANGIDRPLVEWKMPMDEGIEETLPGIEPIGPEGSDSPEGSDASENPDTSPGGASPSSLGTEPAPDQTPEEVRDGEANSPTPAGSERESEETN